MRIIYIFSIFLDALKSAMVNGNFAISNVVESAGEIDFIDMKDTLSLWKDMVSKKKSKESSLELLKVSKMYSFLRV